MNKTDRPEFILALTTLAEVFGRGLTTGVAEAWYEDLRGYQIAQVLGAIREWRRSNVTGFFPVPGQIIQLINAEAPVNCFPQEQTPDPAQSRENLRLLVAAMREEIDRRKALT